GDGRRRHQDGPHRAAQRSHRQLCSALGRRLRLAPLALAGVGLALALPACGANSAAAPEPSTATSAAGGGAEPAPKSKPDPAPSCSNELTGFLEQLEHLRRSLVIGVSYEQYVAELGTVRKSYQGIPVAELDLACVSGPATSAENSFDGYLAAANTWGECVSESGCETAALEPKLQRRWRLAAKQLEAARQALAAG
ncbi:MAG: hypothetical protein JST31_14900, partial [Actinobacteria bacterium]|nr:hypothetical protein [Actinomycetota bacterium]